MPIFTWGLALKLSCRAFKNFNMYIISKLGTSISSLMCLAWIKSWLGSGLWFFCSPKYLLWLFDLDLWEFCFHLALLGGRSVLWCLLRLTCATWESLAIALMCLTVDFEDSIFLASCLTLLAGNLSKSMLEPWWFWKQTPHLLRRTRKYLYARYLEFLVGTWQGTLGFVQYCTTHPQNDCICLKLVSRSNLALILFVCGLQKSSNFGPYDIQAKIFRWQAPWHILIHTKISTPHYYFLAFLGICNMASSQSNMFSHFSFHLRNLWYKLSFTVQSIFGPSIYDINMACTKDCNWLVDGWINYGL